MFVTKRVLFFCPVYRMKVYSLPPLYRLTKQNRNVRTAWVMWMDVYSDLGHRSIAHHYLTYQYSQINQRTHFLSFQRKSVVTSSDSADTRDSKASPPRHSSSKKEHLSSIVREISQARLLSLRKKRSGQSMTLSISDNGKCL